MKIGRSVVALVAVAVVSWSSTVVAEPVDTEGLPSWDDEMTLAMGPGDFDDPGIDSWGPPPGGGRWMRGDRQAGPFGRQRGSHGRHFGAGHGGRGPLQGRFWEIPKVKEGLELTEDQVKVLNRGDSDIKKEGIDLRADLEKAEIDLRGLFKADEINEPLILAKAGEIAEAKSKLHILEVRRHLLIAKTLTLEQRTKAKEAIGARIWKRAQEAQRARRGGRRMERRMGPQRSRLSPEGEF